MKTATLLLSLLALTPACVSQQPGKAPAKEPLVVDAGEVQLTNLIDRCAAYLDCNILCSPQELAQSGQGQTVRLQKALKLDRDGCEEFLTSMLYRSGLALVWLDDKGAMLEVISMSGPRAREVTNRAMERSPEMVLARPNLKLMVTTVVPLEHVNATIATNALRPFFASTGAPSAGGSLTLGNVGTNKALLVSGMQDQVAQAIRLLQKCDVPGSPDGMGMGGADDHLAQLEKRVKALEEQQKQKPAGDDKGNDKGTDKPKSK
jgi:type II secretory pathway component GspD/PulD (secretin)